MILSICIPTYNRISHLNNCLNSIVIAKKKFKEFKFEVCISDNNSKIDPFEIVKNYKKELDIVYKRNNKNLGFAYNAIQVVSMAKGEYSWLIGDDDLIMPNTFIYLNKILYSNIDKDFFFVNSCHLEASFLKDFPHPFDTDRVENKKMKKISELKEDRSVKFLELIDPNVSWEFLTGIFLSIFKTKKWLNEAKSIDMEKIIKPGTWSTLENTFLHSIASMRAFKNSNAYICSRPLSINLWGVREWGSLYEFVEIIRIPELLDYHRSQGLSFKNYFYCKNFSLRNFGSYIIKIIIGGETKGRHYLDFNKHILKNMIFPNFYFSFVIVLFRKIFQLFTFKLKK